VAVGAFLFTLDFRGWRLGFVMVEIEVTPMRIALLIAGAAFSAVVITAVFAQSESNDGSALTRKRYLPEYTASGDLILPKNFNEWVFVGSPLTPSALNDGKANFP
jgi:hypothetical protein